MTKSGRFFFNLSLIVLGLGIGIGLWLTGADFYTTNPWDRHEHPDFQLLRSSGIWGHGLGIVGSILLLINLAFLLRKYVSFFKPFGTLRLWMDIHVMTGLLGPLLILYHSAFFLRTAVATIASGALVILVISGVIGRFIYAMIPHTVAGAEMGKKALEAQVVSAQEHLSKLIPDNHPMWQKIEQLSKPPSTIPSTKIACLIMLPFFLLGTTLQKFRLRRLRNQLLEIEIPSHEPIAPLFQELKDYVLIRRRLHILATYRELMRWWRGMHRIWAVIMIVTLVIHVSVALYMGYFPEIPQ